MTTAPDVWSRSAGWREFFDLLSDAVVVLDASARVVVANTAALRVLPCEIGVPVEQLTAALGAATVRWLRRAATGNREAAAPPAARLADGRTVQIRWRRLDAAHCALHLTPVPESAAVPRDAATVQPAAAASVPLGTMREAIAFLWESPFPTLLQGPDFRIVDANQAFADFSGYPRSHLVGRDAIELHPLEDRPAMLAARERLSRGVGTSMEAMVEGRLIHAGGGERRYRTARRVLIDDAGRPLYLAVVQDTTAEHMAREHADRSLRELDDWFGMSSLGMVLFDERGLLLRTNPAFDALAGASAVSLHDAPAALCALLGWSDLQVLQGLEPGTLPMQRLDWVAPAPGAAPRLLRATVRCYHNVVGERRYMAVVEDRSVEEERDLAQLQVGALMDTAGVALATFQESSGWTPLRPARAGAEGAAPAASEALQAIGRDIVEPASIPEFDRLQTALRQAQRAEVRYEIRHPELGRRWLLTRVEPATLASGQRTTSLVTLDVTEQHQSQQRSEQLLHELSTILESTSAGIAYVRGSTLVRCNRRFEAMLSRPAGSLSGRPVLELLSSETEHITADARTALMQGISYETEFDASVTRNGKQRTRWYSLSVRRCGPPSGAIESITVLTDVTRLKEQQRELETLARDRELMFSLSGVGIAFLRDGRIERANQALADLAGCSVGDLSSLHLRDTFADTEAYERGWRVQERSLRERGHWNGERQLRTRSGRLKWVQVSKRLVTAGDPSGGIIASYVDVHARHRAERAAALQADRTRAILDSVLVGIVTVGANGIEWMNRSACRMFGGNLADFASLPIATVATPGADHPFRRTEGLVDLVEGQVETFECRVRARDQREFSVVGNVVLTGRGPAGRQLTYALLDVERRREAEARMSQAQAQLRRIIGAAPLAITLRDAATLQVLQINEVAARIEGGTPASLIGLTPERMFDAATAVQRRRDMEEALQRADVTRHEYRLEQDGRSRVWDARYLPLSDRPGLPPDQLLLVATDVSEQHAAQQARLEAAVAQREMLVQEVHHRIKNNLQGVAGLLQQIGKRKPEVAGAISEVVGQVQAIAQVYGLQVGASGPLQLISVVRAITESVQRTFGQSIRYAAGGCDTATWLLPEAESIPIALTINELLTNAIKHGAALVDAQVSCTLDCTDAGVQVSIANRGRLAHDFSLARIPGGVSGLGLVRALLPRRSAELALAQRADRVVATLVLKAPSVVRGDATGPVSADATPAHPDA